MELVYLWVEDYKNIHNQGFNFSPRFECSYENNALSICDKKENNNKCKNKNYIENFFGENINVTAIIGKNGSGKSSIIELLSDLILNNEIQKNVFFTIWYKTQIICFTNIKNLDIQYASYKIESLERVAQYNFFSVFYSSNFTNGSLNSILELFSTPSYRTHNQSDFEGTHGYKNSHLKVQSLLNLVFNASRILDYHPTRSATRNMHAFTIKELQENFEIGKILFILQFLKNFGRDYLPLNIKEHDEIAINIQHNRLTAKIHEKSFIEKIRRIIELETDFFLEEGEETYYASINKEEYEKSTKLFLDFLTIHANDLKDDDHFTLTIEEALNFIDLYIDLYRFNRNLQNSFFDFKFKNLSSGEENLILMFALLERGISSFIDHKRGKEEHNIILMLNEMENDFHPQWQKELFNQLLKFLNIIHTHWKSHYDKKINFSIILVSHSPFILSDLPKENVIFLDKFTKNDNAVIARIQNEGNCKNVSDEINIHPFGANIHTLLSHGFFMNEGLMGEFAKSKINEVISNLQDKSKSLSQKQMKSIIATIGEPFLQTKIEQMYKEKFGVDDEIKELQKQQEKINLKIEQLKKQKSENVES